MTGASLFVKDQVATNILSHLSVKKCLILHEQL